jgi:hypothetical protein
VNIMKKSSILLILGFLLVSLFSVSVLAEVPTPGEALEDLGSFFSDLFTGTASMESAYLLSFILYFIIFMAIFVEGLKHLPFFGGKGDLSRPGKWFAFAAAMLATLGIFIGEQVSGRSTQEAVAYVAAPWGSWGGLIIAGIVAFVSYRMIRNTKLFGEEVMRSAALAVAIGLMGVGWLLSPAFFGWGFFIMLIVLIAGVAAHAGKRLRGRSDKVISGAGAGAAVKAGAEVEKAEKIEKKAERKEAAEESFTLKEMESIRKAYHGIGKIRSGLETLKLDKKGVTDKRIYNAMVAVSDYLDDPLEDAKKWGRKISRLARKIKRDFRRLAERDLKKDEEKVLEVSQALEKEIKGAAGDDTRSAKKVNQLLEQLRSKKIKKDGKEAYNFRYLDSAITSLEYLKQRLNKIYVQLGVLFKLEEEIKKKLEKTRSTGKASKLMGARY